NFQILVRNGLTETWMPYTILQSSHTALYQEVNALTLGHLCDEMVGIDLRHLDVWMEVPIGDGRPETSRELIFNDQLLSGGVPPAAMRNLPGQSPITIMAGSQPDLSIAFNQINGKGPSSPGNAKACPDFR